MDENNGKKFLKNPNYFTITVYAVIGFFICALLVKVVFDFSHVWNAVKVVFGVLSPFVVGTIIAYLINPLFKFFDFTFFGKWLHMTKRRGLRKTLALLLAYIIVFGVIGVLIYIIVPQFVTSIKSLVGTIGTFSHTVERWIDGLQEHFKNLNLEVLTDNISTIVPKLMARIQEWAEGLLSGIVSTGVGVISGIISFFMSIIVSIYILSDKLHLESTIRKLYYAWFKPEKAAHVSKVTRECSNIFSNFFTGKIFDSLIIGILCGVMMLILRLPYPLLISVLVGVTNVIPYFGPFIGAIPSILIMLMTGWKQALIFTILILVLQQVDGNIIGPKIIGDSTGLSPIWVIFAITIGSWVGGVAGMLFGVPVMAVIGHIAEEAVNKRLVKNGQLSMVKQEEAPKTIGYTDMIRNIFKKKKKVSIEDSAENVSEAVTDAAEKMKKDLSEMKGTENEVNVKDEEKKDE
ncbi:MAG: AI-2E family transporter [Lachnospiraceae bacterium]|nr:AI-2E family transporter [Lachnospiraceae bacterium]MDO4734629.1 AI-2E family transporter [Lachnospiraceae bacterium]